MLVIPIPKIKMKWRAIFSTILSTLFLILFLIFFIALNIFTVDHNMSIYFYYYKYIYLVMNLNNLTKWGNFLSEVQVSKQFFAH